MPQKKALLLVGLGNPGDAYVTTRHNAGFMVLNKVAESFSIPVEKKKFDALLGRGLIKDSEVILAKPMAFMNLSGIPVQKILNYFKIPFEDMLVIHDDIDLAFGRLQIKENGGHGGHKGLKSIIETVGSNNFVRLRIGIGRSEDYVDIANYVLDQFNTNEKNVLDRMIEKARDAVVATICKGTKKAMNIFNDKRLITTQVQSPKVHGSRLESDED
ncbi:MAG: aminoacyl-tRNA hydrolase [Proteobacteria bacterium]|nr:aminoacyl-tRNA hydrolase [Desulfobacteraceae bacterium]MBU3981829.1 aminoacyl-tRNA hydrolase [Pseudomonadota bacterium]MBU4013779.1 aminoacyl-tRNA hydrolase [Pseudomonadota bacterium]MBU4066787.1 aminoacyl-tRNA hydrolase [Pseudomonadota bacterium]MBU4100519.1 aminoacyl-tRNA hydrolase [Pseudomonadota bacterium]